jgi:hypothetical protein
MRLPRILTCALMVLILSCVCCAEKNWESTPDKLSFKAGDDFQKNKTALKGVSLELFSKTKNAQLVLTTSGIPKPKDAKKAPVVTAGDFIKAFPVLSTENKITVHAGPIKMSVSGKPAAVYEVENQESKGYQTVYAYVGRGTKPYALILNYPSPRNPEMVKLMKRVLGSVKHL